MMPFTQNTRQPVRAALMGIGLGGALGFALVFSFTIVATWGWQDYEIRGVLLRLASGMSFWFLISLPITLLLTILLLKLIEDAGLKGINSLLTQSVLAGLLGMVSGILAWLPFDARWEELLPGALVGLSICAVLPFVSFKTSHKRSARNGS